MIPKFNLPLPYWFQIGAASQEEAQRSTTLFSFQLRETSVRLDRGQTLDFEAEMLTGAGRKMSVDTTLSETGLTGIEDPDSVELSGLEQWFEASCAAVPGNGFADYYFRMVRLKATARPSGDSAEIYVPVLYCHQTMQLSGFDAGSGSVYRDIYAVPEFVLPTCTPLMVPASLQPFPADRNSSVAPWRRWLRRGDVDTPPAMTEEVCYIRNVGGTDTVRRIKGTLDLTQAAQPGGIINNATGDWEYSVYPVVASYKASSSGLCALAAKPGDYDMVRPLYARADGDRFHQAVFFDPRPFDFSMAFVNTFGMMEELWFHASVTPQHERDTDLARGGGRMFMQSRSSELTFKVEMAGLRHEECVALRAAHAAPMVHITVDGLAADAFITELDIKEESVYVPGECSMTLRLVDAETDCGPFGAMPARVHTDDFHEYHN